MKIEFDIQDISRDEVIESMARQLLVEWHEETDPESGPQTYRRQTKLGEQMKHYLDSKIAELADVLVREQFDKVVIQRIAAQVDAVLAEGWQVTNQYGEARGPKVDLKGRITELLLKPGRDSYGNGESMTPIDRQVKAAIDGLIGKEFAKDIETARKSLKAQLDASVAAKFTDTLKKALGL